MARLDSAHPENVEGPWFVDTRCTRCDVARHWAPGLIEMDRDGRSYLARQPDGPEESAAFFRGQTFQSWDVLAESMDRLSRLRVEWVFAGHGMWHNVGTELYAEQMARLGADMRHIGQADWAQRPHAAYGWY